jgi:DNA-binding transcriptional ArsR family regulator
MPYYKSGVIVMALRIEQNVDEIKCTVRCSEVIEYIAILSMLSDIKHHEYAREYFEVLNKNISQNNMGTLKLISEMPFQGLEFIELVLDSREFDDITSFANKLSSYNDENFIYYLAGEVFSIEKIMKVKYNHEEFNNFMGELPWVIRKNINIYEYIIYETAKFKQNVIELFKQLENECVKNIIEKFKEKYKNTIKAIETKLEENNPLDVASEILNKKVEKDENVKEFIFVPSYFISPHYLLAFNKYANLIIYDMRRNSYKSKQQLNEHLVEELGVISDKTRLELLRLLILQPTYGKILSSRLQLTTATISHHIEKLKEFNLVNEIRNKNTKHFSANIEEIDKLIGGLKDYLYNK